MPENIQHIIDKARELSDSIKNHEITLRYKNILLKMSKDRKARDLYAELVRMGKEINAALAREEKTEPRSSSEYEALRIELEQNPLIKECIRLQREYLDLLKKIIERIKNPS